MSTGPDPFSADLAANWKNAPHECIMFVGRSSVPAGGLGRGSAHCSRESHRGERAEIGRPAVGASLSK